MKNKLVLSRLLPLAVRFAIAGLEGAHPTLLHANTPDIATINAAEDDTDAKRMNGYALTDFGDFSRNWHLVTVRYRQDTGEQRFIYANDKAWKTLIDRTGKYPDGAVFAKIGMATQEDPAFASSLVPGTIRRYQIMVHHHNRHSNTGGWGYALFNADGSAHPNQDGSEQQTTAACHACHQLVPERGFVFAQPMRVGLPTKAAPSGPAPGLLPRVTFEAVGVTGLLPDLVRRLPPATATVSLVKGNMSQHLFSGTLDEIRPTLAAEALRSGRPAVLLGTDARFSAVFAVDAVAPQASCTTVEGATGLLMQSVTSGPLVTKSDQSSNMLTFCQPR